MAINCCQNCGNHFWRYRRDHPPKGFCSLPCADGLKPAGEISIWPRAALQQMHRHLLAVHGTNSVLQWFDCDECDRLQAQYAASLAFYVTDVTAEIHKAAKPSWERIPGASK